MICPNCGLELIWHDSFGLFAAHQSGKKVGDIYKCPSEDFAESDDDTCSSGVHNFYFHMYADDGELREGYPC